MNLRSLILMAKLAITVGLVACSKPIGIRAQKVKVRTDSLLAPVSGAAWHRLYWIMRINRPEDRAHSDREART